MHILTQPGVAAGMLGDAALADQGLLSRILVAAPGSPAGTRFWKDPNPESEEALRRYGATITEFLEHLMPTAQGKGNELEPPPLVFPPNAKQTLVKFNDHIESQIGPRGSLESVRGFANKAPEHAACIAGIIATIEHGKIGGGEIDHEVIAAASRSWSSIFRKRSACLRRGAPTRR